MVMLWSCCGWGGGGGQIRLPLLLAGAPSSSFIGYVLSSFNFCGEVLQAQLWAGPALMRSTLQCAHPHAPHPFQQMDALVELRTRLRGDPSLQGVKLTFLPFFMKARLVCASVLLCCTFLPVCWVVHSHLHNSRGRAALCPALAAAVLLHRAGQHRRYRTPRSPPVQAAALALRGVGIIPSCQRQPGTRSGILLCHFPSPTAGSSACPSGVSFGERQPGA